MASDTYDPDLNLQSFNDHGIFTLEELNQLSHVRVINNVPLRDHITPHYANLGLIKLPDIVKLNTCQLIYDHFVKAV